MSPEVGSVVRLASGGPEMTVSEVVGSSVTCVWFEELSNPLGGKVWGELRTRAVRFSALVIVR